MKILIATDGSEEATSLSSLLRLLPIESRSEVHIMHACSPLMMEDKSFTERARSSIKEYNKNILQKAKEIVENVVKKIDVSVFSVRTSVEE